jgi:hypothetical protein
MSNFPAKERCFFLRPQDIYITIHGRQARSEGQICSARLWIREERRLRVFENRVLRRVFGPKRDEVTGNGENYIFRSLTL